jgi:N-acyl-D-amino-acid deacylase
MGRKGWFFISMVILTGLLLSIACERVPRYDIIVKNGRIIDGSGNPFYYADIGIKKGKIATIGDLTGAKAGKLIDVDGKYVVPGFIDIHTHIDRKLDEMGTADNYVLQGVTTALGGNCGGSPFPFDEYFKKLEKNGISLNFACLVGHNTIREEVMGFKDADPTDEEMAEMKRLVAQAMEDGAVGISTGLAYMPGVYAETDELIELSKVVAGYGGFYASHIRSHGDEIFEAVEEAIEIGRKAGCRVQVSHIKLAKDTVWGKTAELIQIFDDARTEGLEVYCDMYPYIATSSGFSSSFPGWAREGGLEKFIERTRDPGLYAEMKKELIKRRFTSSRGIDTVSAIIVSRYEKDPSFEGKNLAEILKMRGKKPTVSNAADLVIEIMVNGDAQGVFFQMCEEDTEALLAYPYNMVASDGALAKPGEGFPHPRSYGTFPRAISHYVRGQKIMRLEKAIRKMTSLPAEVLRLSDRGIIRPGMCADIVVFDYDEIKDTAIYKDPHQYPAGIDYVIVNGKVVAEKGKLTGERPGMVLYGPGKKK